MSALSWVCEPNRGRSEFGFRGAALLVLLVLLASGCGKKKVKVAAPAGVPAAATIEYGIASWYGHPYHGRRAASGEIYDMDKLTAAHRTLPFGTWVRVNNLDNGEAVEVRINDRGPFVAGRIVDLSRAAARNINMIGPGTAQVRLEVMAAPAAIVVGTFAVQVGAFRSRDNAERLRGRMIQLYGSARLVPRSGSPRLWRVLVGQEELQEAAEGLAEKIRAEFGPAFVVRVDSDSP